MVGKVLVYASKDVEDWKKAQELLQKAPIAFTAWEAQEPPVGGCGSKIDVRSFMKKEPVSKTIYKIEVKKPDAENAKQLLAGNVLPVRSFGVML